MARENRSYPPSQKTTALPVDECEKVFRFGEMFADGQKSFEYAADNSYEAATRKYGREAESF